MLIEICSDSGYIVRAQSNKLYVGYEGNVRVELWRSNVQRVTIFKESILNMKFAKRLDVRGSHPTLQNNKYVRRWIC